MNVKLGKLLTLALISTVLMSFAAVLPAFAGADGNVFMINPLSGDGNFFFDTTTKGYGDTFKVRIEWHDPDGNGLFGWQVLVAWNIAHINYTGYSLPTGHVFEGQSYSDPPASVDYALGTVLKAASMQTGYVNVTTDKPLVELTFRIIAVPSILDPVITSPITFNKTNAVGGTYLLNDLGAKMAIDFTGGVYRFEWIAPTETPYLEVRDPLDGDHEIVADAVGQIKDIDIYIHNCSSAWEMISVQFELWYNTTLLSYVGTATNPQFVNGTFMESFQGPGELGTVYLVVADFEGQPPPHGAPPGQNYFLVGVMKLPDIYGEWHPPFPTGSGKLVTLKVQTLLQGLFPEILTCPLEIKDAKFYNRYGDPITGGTNVDGTYKMLPKVLGRAIDVFTQYPKPFGGQGLGQNSDMYWPQKEVCLYANVTYNDWPEQGKDVAFQVIDPYGGVWALLYARTNATGVASVCFRLPWPCDEFEYWFGEWTVIATVDVACDIVNDTLHFKYDHLVNIVSVTLNKTAYKHCEYMNITVEFKSYAMQTYNVTVTMTALDETGVPFGYIYVQTTIGGAIYCHYKYYEVEGAIHVIKWARAGTGSLIVGVLSDFPFNGGTVISGPFDPVTFQILAEWAI